MPEVRSAESADAAVVGQILAAGFGDDPVLSWVFSEGRRSEQLGVFFGFLAREALVPLGATYLADGAVACWTPPAPPPWPEERSRRFGELLSTVCAPGELERLNVLDTEMEAHHPEARHWYLGSIATLPERQGKGLGTALLGATLAQVDGDGLPAYLESTNPRNVPLYERHGFTVTGEIALPDGPALTAMWRKAKPAEAQAR